ncbi:RPAP1-like protein [Lipomyces arxii]|uniref:RPAP1-like protein n=1 Tax=Lipomyces arxii TaxID=56418 RepID=UPI0034CDEC86
MDLVHDIIERSRSTVTAKPPKPKSPTGSAGRERPGKSLWRSRMNKASESGAKSTLERFSEAARIDAENKDMLAAMAPEEIEAERIALEAALPPGLISRILKRDPTAADAILMGDDDPITEHMKAPAEKLDQDAPVDVDVVIPVATTVTPITRDKVPSPEMVSIEERTEVLKQEEAQNEDKTAEEAGSSGTHFLKPVQTDELDPDAPDFYDKLHQKYFPDLSNDPSRMAWMKPVSEEEDKSSPYNPTQDSVLPVDIRFDFKGNVIPPSMSTSMPTTLGLHHHSDSPGYAGYTVAELSHLCRSAVPAQRAIAVQAMGRILYKLGVNAYGEYIGDTLWDIVQDMHVIDSLYEAADERKTRHMGLRAYAIEALWLWKKGGGRKRTTD